MREKNAFMPVKNRAFPLPGQDANSGAATGLAWVVLATLAWLPACSDEPSSHGPDGSALDTAELIDGDTGSQPTGVTFTVVAHPVESCGSWQPDHQAGLSYQTPTNLRIGLMSVDLLRSHDDEEPQGLALGEPVVAVNLSAGEELVSVDTGSIAEGTYTHIRLRLAYSKIDLQATAHLIRDVSGTLTLDMALSNHETAENPVRSQGQYTATFMVYGQPYSMSGVTPLNCVLSAWGGIAATVGSVFDVTVPIPPGSIVVDHGSAEPLRVDLVFPVMDTFSWRDLDEPGFSPGVLDIRQPPQAFEMPDSLFECNLLMADRCLSTAVVPIHPTWPMSDSTASFCTDGEQVVEDCPGPGGPAYGQDANYSIHPPQFEIGQDVVTDEVTGLVWQRDTAPATFDWWEARDYCFGLDLDGHDDWRLPSRIELVSLLDLGYLDPTIDSDVFADTPSDFFWTSSPVPFLNMAYGVRFELGFIYDHDPHGTGRVRCVSGDYTPPDPRFDIGDLVVEDLGTGSTWQRRPVADVLGWSPALAACEALELDGHDDWRLPTIKELQTIVDERRLQPSIDVVAFPDTPSEWFWSSTPIEFPPDEGWATSFTDGYASIHAFAELHRVRCVR